MRMKSIILLVIGMVLFISSCSDDRNELDHTTQYAIINADITSFNKNIPTDHLLLGEAEYVIRRARLYAFDGNKLDNMVYIDNNTSVANILMNLKVKQSSSKTLYIILNEPLQGEFQHKLALINHPDAFELIEYEMAEYITKAYNSDATFTKNDFCLPMFGVKENINTTTSNAILPIKVEMDVTRSMARVDVMVQKLSSVTHAITIDQNTELSIINNSTKGMLAPSIIKYLNLVNQESACKGSTTPLIVPIKNSSNNENSIRAFSFYTPERRCDTPSKLLGFKLGKVNYNGKTYDFDVTIGNQPGNTLSSIERNKVYSIYCTFTLKEIDVNIRIKDWIEKNINGNIEGSKLNFSQSTINMDWGQLNNSYTASLKVASDGIITFEGFEYRTITTLDGSNLPEWLPRSSITGLPDGKGKAHNIKMSYKVIEINDNSIVKLWFKTGSIKKCVTVNYDNGFIPNEILRSDALYPWTQNLPPNGIQLNKTGCVHPMDKAIAEKAMLWSSDVTTLTFDISKEGKHGHLHGKGPYNTDWMEYTFIQAFSVARICREIGPNWYVPSIDELITVRRSQVYLGKSYRFQSTVYWSSTAYYSDNRYMYVSKDNVLTQPHLAIKNDPSFLLRCFRND